MEKVESLKQQYTCRTDGPHVTSVKFKAVNVFTGTAKVFTRCVSMCRFYASPMLERPIRRTAYLSLKNRNEPRPITTTTNERNYASVDGGERSLLLGAIARYAPIRENEYE